MIDPQVSCKALLWFVASASALPLGTITYHGWAHFKVAQLNRFLHMQQGFFAIECRFLHRDMGNH